MLIEIIAWYSSLPEGGIPTCGTTNKLLVNFAEH